MAMLTATCRRGAEAAAARAAATGQSHVKCVTQPLSHISQAGCICSYSILWSLQVARCFISSSSCCRRRRWFSSHVFRPHSEVVAG
jgi:hypothetical protein